MTKLFFKEAEKMFSIPHDNIVNFYISNISVNGISFNLTNPPENLEDGDRIPSCSLRIGDEILTVNSIVIRNQSDIGLLFETFESFGYDKLHKYLLDAPSRQLMHIKNN